MAKNKNVEISLEEKLKKALVPVDEQPYAIPSNWVWTRLTNLCDVKGGKRIPKGEEFSNEKTKNVYLRVSDFNNYSINQDKLKYISDDLAENLKNYKISTEDLYLSIAGTIGKIGIIPYELDKSFLTENAVKLTNISNATNNKFLLNCFKTNFIQNLISDSITSSGQPKLAIFRIENFSIPLPPLEEQKRIVEKLDFLFEKTKRAKEIIEEIKVNIENRKISILDRAFKGTLTSKWRSESKTSDVKELLKSINEEKIKKWEEDCLQAEKGGNKKPKKPTITEVKDMIVPVDEQPYKLPDSWVWVRLENLCSKITDGAHKTPKYTNSGVPFISVKDVYDNQISFDDTKFISQEEHNELYKRCNPEYDDILLTKSGTIGRTAVVKTRDEFSLFVSVALLKNYKNVINSNYLSLNIQDFFNKTNISQTIKGGVIKNYHISDMKEQLIPLPPLEEQQEIVRILDEVLENENKVKELLELEERIDILEKSILHKAFKGELGTQNSSDESALNLLKSIL